VADAPAQGPQANAGTDADERVDLVLWHWKDPRLQSQQQVQENADRNFSYLAQYRVASKTFIRLADDDVRSVNLAPKHQYAIGFDDREYELMGNLSGQRFRDVYAIDMATGERRLAIKRARWYNGVSPDGQSILFYDNGHFHVQSLATGQSRNITEGAPVRFVNVENDTNVVDPPTQVVGWAKDGKSVLINDLWDIWRVPVEGGQFVNLTVNGRPTACGTSSASRSISRRARRGDRPDEAAVLPRLRRVDEEGRHRAARPGQDGPSDGALGRRVVRPPDEGREGRTLLYTRETATEPADYYATDAKFGEPKRLTDMRPQVANFHWTAGVRLVDYVSDKGDKLQAALFLPG
jgi:hypothetical protein